MQITQALLSMTANRTAETPQGDTENGTFGALFAAVAAGGKAADSVDAAQLTFDQGTPAPLLTAKGDTVPVAMIPFGDIPAPKDVELADADLTPDMPMLLRAAVPQPVVVHDNHRRAPEVRDAQNDATQSDATQSDAKAATETDVLAGIDAGQPPLQALPVSSVSPSPAITSERVDAGQVESAAEGEAVTEPSKKIRATASLAEAFFAVPEANTAPSTAPIVPREAAYSRAAPVTVALEMRSVQVDAVKEAGATVASGPHPEPPLAKPAAIAEKPPVFDTVPETLPATEQTSTHATETRVPAGATVAAVTPAAQLASAAIPSVTTPVEARAPAEMSQQKPPKSALAHQSEAAVTSAPPVAPAAHTAMQTAPKLATPSAGPVLQDGVAPPPEIGTRSVAVEPPARVGQGPAAMPATAPAPVSAQGLQQAATIAEMPQAGARGADRPGERPQNTAPRIEGSRSERASETAAAPAQTVLAAAMPAVKPRTGGTAHPMPGAQGDASVAQAGQGPADAGESAVAGRLDAPADLARAQSASPLREAPPSETQVERPVASNTAPAPEASVQAGADSLVGEIAKPLERGNIEALANVIPSERTALGDRVSSQLIHAAQSMSDGPLEIRLDPEELGKVRMTLHAQDQEIRVVLAAERGETMELMRRHIETLTSDFKALGYKDISFTFQSSAENGAQNFTGGARDQASGGSDGAGDQPRGEQHGQNGQPGGEGRHRDADPDALARLDLTGRSGMDLRL
ncbi:Flagellar hook-length control protein FliK [Aquimixticola soesokkakensis]|uniref:Flagellar hook-length control protein FliK n=1 Tax=Aquimixticola soesokkakensis TaxID=1519096 RepID=A0A1Y5RC26_9RHOB|nr:flagellar hook-length control protein FliK [Aquimixticola soesokkakensis]SLN13829.1 Flagellar hook-length control protein FliK [Aquimixticola soesokkakensis]